MGKCLGKSKSNNSAKESNPSHAGKPSDPPFLSIIPGAQQSPGASPLPTTSRLPFSFTIKGSLSTKAQSPSQDKPQFSSLGHDFPPLSSCGIACVCRKGLKSEKFNQDDFCVARAGGMLLLCVFDGHGPDGHKIAAIARDSLPAMLLAGASEGGFTQQVRKTFDAVQRDLERNHEELSLDLSGTTVSVVRLQDRVLQYANVGDSTIVLARRVYGKLRGEAISTDHKPNSVGERERIERSGGVVKKVDGDACYRIFEAGTGLPGIALSRALGDAKAHKLGVSHEPEVGSVTLSPEHEFVLLCSDGVWEFISAEEAVQIVGEHPRSDSQAAAEALVGLAWSRWLQEEVNTVDDLTCVLAYLPVTLCPS